MTEAEKIALALLNEVADQYGMMEYTRIDRGLTHLEALCRAIEQHEAFKREVSEAVEKALSYGGLESLRREAVLSRFIIKTPVDPLVGVVEEAIAGCPLKTAVQLRQALAARGLQITEVGQ